MKEIEIIPIAAKKAKKRGIKKEQIEDTIAHPMQVAEGYGGRKVAQSKILIERRRNIF